MGNGKANGNDLWFRVQGLEFLSFGLRASGSGVLGIPPNNGDSNGKANGM